MAPMPTMEAPGAKSQLAQQFEKRFDRGQNASAEWRRQAREFYRTYGGDPWPDGVKELLEDEGRPATSFNYSLSYINAVLGQDIADRKEARFEGQDQNDTLDQFCGETFTKVVRALYNKCNGYREEIEAEQDQLITGVGCMEGLLDTTRFPIFPKAEAIDIQEMYWDPDAKKHNLRDARWVCRRKLWYVEDAKAKWPTKSELLERLAKGQPKSGGQPFPRTVHASGYRDRSQASENQAQLEDHVYIYDYQFKRPTKIVVYQDPVTGERKKVSPEDYREIKAALDAEVDPATGAPLYERIDAVELFVQKVYRAFLAGSDSQGVEVVEDEEELDSEMFTYRFATGYRSKTANGKVQFFGLMQLIYEPQLWTAKAISAAIEHLARSPKGGGGFINSDILVDPEDFKKNGSKTGHWALVNPQTTSIRDNIHERQQPQFHQGYERLFDVAEHAMSQLTTITDYFKGTASAERSNVLVRNLQGQTIMVLNPLVDPMNQMRVEVAQLLAKLAQRHLAAVDFNRLVGKLEVVGVTHQIKKGPIGEDVWVAGQPVLEPLTIQDEVSGGAVPITPYDVVSDRDIFEFDLEVDLGPASVTQKTAVWNNFTSNHFLQETMKSLPQIGNRLVPVIVKNMPGLSTEEARQIEQDVREELRQMKLQGTAQGVMESLPNLPPEALMQVMQTVQQMLGGAMQPPPDQGAPVEQGPM